MSAIVSSTYLQQQRTIRHTELSQSLEDDKLSSDVWKRREEGKCDGRDGADGLDWKRKGKLGVAVAGRVIACRFWTGLGTQGRSSGNFNAEFGFDYNQVNEIFKVIENSKYGNYIYQCHDNHGIKGK